MRVTLDEHDLAVAGGMPLAVARAILERVMRLPSFRADAADWRCITGLKYFCGSMQWVWVGPTADRPHAPLQLPQEPLGFATRDLAEQAGRRFGFTSICCLDREAPRTEAIRLLACDCETHKRYDFIGTMDSQ